jgi:hypothetical protein
LRDVLFTNGVDFFGVSRHRCGQGERGIQGLSRSFGE